VLLLVLAASTTAFAQDAVVREATGGQLRATKGSYREPSCNNEQVAYDAEVIDLNGDGTPEVFVRLHGICMGGNAGVHLSLYIKDRVGKWINQFGFPGDYTILKTRSKGFPDIEIVGPGACSPAWRWNGAAYALWKSAEARAAGRPGSTVNGGRYEGAETGGSGAHEAPRRRAVSRPEPRTLCRQSNAMLMLAVRQPAAPLRSEDGGRDEGPVRSD
jgi:hypothetical protein